MQAYHNDQAVKDKYIARVRAHREADNLVRGATGQGGKGCAVWCTLNDYNHKSYETELGIPEWLARVEDTLFEGMPEKDAMEWPERFLAAIPLGADLEKIKAPFMVYLMRSTLKNFDHEKFPDCKKVIDDVIALYESGETDRNKFRSVWSAWSAAWSVWSAESASRSTTEFAAWSAAESTAWSAGYAASAVIFAAESATESAASAAHKEFADELLKLMGGLK